MDIEEDNMVLFVGAIRIREECIQEVERAVREFIPHVREEEGTLEYVVYHGVEDPTKILFYEVYRDEEAQNDHRAGEHLGALVTTIRASAQGDMFLGEFEEMASK